MAHFYFRELKENQISVFLPYTIPLSTTHKHMIFTPFTTPNINSELITSSKQITVKYTINTMNTA